jgi:hypothetical protein
MVVFREVSWWSFGVVFIVGRDIHAVERARVGESDSW